MSDDEPRLAPDVAGQRHMALSLVAEACATLRRGPAGYEEELRTVRQLQHAFRRGNELGFMGDLKLALAAHGFPVE